MITGEIDEFTYPRLTTALAGLADGDGDIHLELTAVQYCDLAGLRALIRLSAGHGDRPDHESRRVILHGLPAHPKTVLHILGWESSPAWSSRASRTEHHPDPRRQPFRPVMPGQPSTAAWQVPTG